MSAINPYNLSQENLEKFLDVKISTSQIQKIAKKIENILINPVLNKRCGIMDGLRFGHNLYEVLFIPGKIDLILKFNKISKKGTELNSANISKSF